METNSLQNLYKLWNIIIQIYDIQFFIYVSMGGYINNYKYGYTYGYIIWNLDTVTIYLKTRRETYV